MSDTCVLLKTSQGIKHAMYIEFLFKWYDMNILLPTYVKQRRVNFVKHLDMVIFSQLTCDHA